MPKNVNTNMADNGADDKGYTIAYKRAVGNPKDNKKTVVAGIHGNGEFWKARQLSSRKRFPVKGSVAPIRKGVPVSNMYQHGNNFNLAQNVADNERHAHINNAFYEMGVGNKNWNDPYAYRKSARKKK